MKRPARIKILGKPFKIEYVPSDHPGLKDGKEELSGHIANEKQKIHILDGTPLETEQDTVLHEVFHGIDYATSEDEISENDIRRLATAFLAVIKDNPGFVSYLRQKNRKDEVQKAD